MTAWGWSGPNLVSRAVSADVERAHPDRHVEDLSRTRLIVSRSHAGGVHDVAERVFGKEANVTAAGGAGFKAWEVRKVKVFLMNVIRGALFNELLFLGSVF